MALIFGTYRMERDIVPDMVNAALKLGITRFDTAQLYGTESVLAQCLPENCIVTTKFTIPQVKKAIKSSTKRFDGRRIDMMLLHRPMQHETWKELTENFPRCGVSNYDATDMERLLTYCEANNLPTPMVNQIEVHPFIDCLSTVKYCLDRGIAVEAHTVLTQGKHLTFGPLVALSLKYGKSPAQMLVKWATQHGCNVCISSTNVEHLTELADTNFVIDDCDMESMDNFHKELTHRFYVHKKPVTDLDGVVATLKADLQSEHPSSLCNSVQHSNVVLAKAMYPDLTDAQAVNKLRIDLKNLRSKFIVSVQERRRQRKGLSSCCLKQHDGHEYGPQILYPRPMPVEITDPSEFESIFAFLENAKVPTRTLFHKGATFDDGRLDLCKQVVGPSSIVSLCEAVKRSSIVRHFLLGNNVALQSDKEKGAQAIASVMASDVPIETWYLAGNCIDHEALSVMSDALVNNKSAKALWLKRNHIGPQVSSLNSMLCLNKTLTLLDLANCALGDEGVKTLLSNPEQLSLKHLYLDANAIETEGAKAVADWCRVGNVRTLFLSINRLGDENCATICRALNGTKIKRLCLSSTRCGDQTVKTLATGSYPSLISLDLGCYKSTKDMGEQPGNLLTDDSVGDVVTLMNSGLKYLSLVESGLSDEALNSLPEVDGLSIDYGHRSRRYVHTKDQLRIVKHPKCVYNIDSIYRGKM